MKNKITGKKHRKIALHLKLKLFSLGILIPFSVLILYLIYALLVYSGNYNKIVKNITEANAYNIDLKEDVDYSLYRMIIGYQTAAEFAEKSGGEYQNPYDEIREARESFSHLAEITTTPGNDKRIQMILRNLDTLERRIKEIEDTCLQSGHYDENMLRLDNNIRILTELLQENIQRYIYYEAKNLESMRGELEMQLYRAVAIGAIAFAAVFILSSILSTLLARSVSKPIEELCRTTELVAKGDFETRVEEEGGDEISVLTASFNSMIGQIGVLVEHIRTEQLHLRNTELRLLQEQINPHFLYNTLDTIIWLSEAGKNKEVVDMVTSLSQFFRTTLSEGRDRITIREEEAHVRSYLEIQQFRYRDILEYEIDIPQELYAYSIMKLTLQPLVENALYHGVKNKRGMGRITIDGGLVPVQEAEQTAQNDSLLKQDICLRVSDNGIGMTPEELEELQQRICTPAEERDGSFGLANVQERIRLNYGEKYGLKLASEYGKGTVVMVLIPAIIPTIERK